jgi:hypothetical protein
MTGYGSNRDENPHRHSYCPETGKKLFLTRRLAKDERRSHVAKQRLNIYKCQFCGGFHMTSQVQR